MVHGCPRATLQCALCGTAFIGDPVWFGSGAPMAKRMYHLHASPGHEYYLAITFSFVGKRSVSSIFESRVPSVESRRMGGHCSRNKIVKTLLLSGAFVCVFF